MDGGFHVFDFGDDGAVGHGEDSVGLYRRGLVGAGLAQGRALVFGIPADGVLLAAVGEGQLHIGGIGGLDVFGAEHVGLSAVAAGLAIEGEGDGVENGGLACAGVAGDQVQAPGAESFKIQLLDPGVGAEAGHGQFQRSHALSSQMDSMSSRVKFFWMSLMGWLFWSSYSSSKSSRGDLRWTFSALSMMQLERVRVLS